MLVHKARKRFGQNFLQNSTIISHIIQTTNLLADDNVIEIGPGLGALTEPLLKKLPRLTVIELDNDLVNHWHNKNIAHLHLIHADALTIDYKQLGNRLRILGNLPYNIATALLLRLIEHKHCIKDLHFMMQKEVVQRLTAVPGTKHWGRLSIIAQYHFKIHYLFEIDAESFDPKPKVQSAMVSLVPHRAYPEVDLIHFQKLVAQAFNMRRKTLANNLKLLISAKELFELNIDPNSRPEQNDIINYIKITHYLTSLKEI